MNGRTYFQAQADEYVESRVPCFGIFIMEVWLSLDMRFPKIKRIVMGSLQ